MQGEEERKTLLASLTVDGASIEDLCLNFTLPGYNHHELVVCWRKP